MSGHSQAREVDVEQQEASALAVPCHLPSSSQFTSPGNSTTSELSQPHPFAGTGIETDAGQRGVLPLFVSLITHTHFDGPLT